MRVMNTLWAPRAPTMEAEDPEIKNDTPAEETSPAEPVAEAPAEPAAPPAAEPEEKKEDWVDKWVGVDLDGTLAEEDEWVDHVTIGKPVSAVVKLIKDYLSKGIAVKIMTARVSGDNTKEIEETKEAISKYTEEHIGQALESTCVKDKGMRIIYDNRAKQVITNTGEVVAPEQEVSVEKFPVSTVWNLARPMR